MKGAGGLAAWGSGPVCSGEHRNSGPTGIPPPLLFALALARTAPEGPRYQEKPVPELQMLELVARLRAQKSGDSGSAPCPGCKTPLQAHYCGSLGLSFPTGSSSTTPLGWRLTMSWHVCDQLGGWARVAPGGPTCPLQASRGQRTRPGVGKGQRSGHCVHLPLPPQGLPFMPSTLHVPCANYL